MLSFHFGEMGGGIAELPLKEKDSDCSGVAQHGLVLGSSDHVKPNPSEPTQSAHRAFQPDSSQESVKSKSSCLAPRASAIKDQGCFEAVAARIEAPQRGSTRSVYEATWTIFTKWCHINQMDIRAPPIKSISVPGQEVIAKYYLWLQIRHCRQTGKFSH